ncbi:hypothetical protein MMC28_007563 [Mycoblastus sanguinarius]|nr:hypothetical protein [Mycoblastus sanguinarius]
MNDLAVVLAAQGKYAPAATLYRRALAGRQKLLGTGHPDTLCTLNNLAAALTHLDQRAEAETLLHEVLHRAAAASSASTTNDVDVPDIAVSLWNLADLLHRQKRFDEAYPLYERACAVYAQRLGPQHSSCATQSADMRKEKDRRARGGVWRFDAVHLLVGLGEEALGGMATVHKYIMR